MGKIATTVGMPSRSALMDALRDVNRSYKDKDKLSARVSFVKGELRKLPAARTGTYLRVLVENPMQLQNILDPQYPLRREANAFANAFSHPPRDVIERYIEETMRELPDGRDVMEFCFEFLRAVTIALPLIFSFL